MSIDYFSKFVEFLRFRQEKSRLEIQLQWVAVVLFLGCIVLGFFIPIYTDEIQWKVFGSRLFIDDYKLVYGFPVCSDGYLLAPPWSWWPARIWDSILYSNMSHPIKHRISGILGLGTLLFLGQFYLGKVNKSDRIGNLSFFIVFLSAGTLPLLLVFNRPEQNLLIYLMALSFLPIFFVNRCTSTGKQDSFKAILLFILTCIMLANHPKETIFLLPVIVTAVLVIKDWKKIIILFSCLTASVFETVRFWSLRTTCKESPWLTNTLQSLNLKPALLLNHPEQFFREGFSNLSRIYEYLANTKILMSYQSEWLSRSPDDLSDLALTANRYIGFPSAIAGILIVIGIFSLVRSKTQAWRLLLPLSILLSITAVIFLQTNKNFYETGLILPALLIIVILTFGGKLSNQNPRWLRLIILMLVVNSCLQSVALIYETAARSATGWIRNQDIQNQRHSVYEVLADECHLAKENPPDNIIEDESTYSFLWRSKNPIFVHSVFGWWATGTKYQEIFDRRKPSFIFVDNCSNIPDELLKNAHRFKNACCVNFSEKNKD